MLRVPAIIFLVLIASCAYFVSWDDLMESWVGRDISDILQLWGEPDSINEHGGGKKAYEYRGRADSSCIYAWIADGDGIIVDFYYEGYCRPIG